MPSRITSVTLIGNSMLLRLADARQLIVPFSNHPSLYKATKEQRENCRIIGMGAGIHWPDLDEDLSLKGLMSMEY